MHHANDHGFRPIPPGPCACTTIRKAARAISRVYEDALAAAGLTATQFAILRTLERIGDLPLSRLADELVMDRTSLYRGIRPVTENGFIVVVCTQSGRSKIARLTPEGRAAIEGALPHWEEAQGRFLDRFGQGEWSDLASALLGVVSVTSSL